MRLAWSVATVQLIAPFVAAGLVIVAAVDWLGPWDGILLPALMIGGFVLAAGGLSALFVPISDWEAARTAERGLDARDALTTALEFSNEEEPLHRAIQRRAESVIATRKPREAVGLVASQRSLGIATTLIAAALLVGLLPPLGGDGAQTTGFGEIAAGEAAEAERMADAIETAGMANADELAEQLRSLADELRRSDSLEEALEAIDEAQTNLEGKLDADFLSQKAAVQGLTRDLGLRPLVDDAPVEAAAQLQQLAAELDELSAQQQLATSDRLRELAESQNAGNPALAEELFSASAALSAGDTSAAKSALERAAGVQAGALDAARAQQSITETVRSLDASKARLDGGEGAASGSGTGSGEGAGQGQGQKDDNAPGLGRGQAPGQGQGQGGAAGQISSVTAGDGDAQGQGGQASIGHGDETNAGTEPRVDTVYDPVDLGLVADQLQIGIEGGASQGQLTGKGDAPTHRGESVVPYTEVLPDYLNQAADALSTLEVPPSMRQIVESYFDGLAAQAR
jgi:hypothetical protein